MLAIGLMLKKPYEKSVVVYLNGKFKPQADIIAGSLSAQVANDFPEGEEGGADIIIILGEDYAVSQ